jgi:hypothetical protein
MTNVAQNTSHPAVTMKFESTPARGGKTNQLMMPNTTHIIVANTMPSSNPCPKTHCRSISQLHCLMKGKCNHRRRKNNNPTNPSKGSKFVFETKEVIVPPISMSVNNGIKVLNSQFAKGS